MSEVSKEIAAPTAALGERLLIIDDDLDIWQAYGQVLTPQQSLQNSAVDQLGELLGNQSQQIQPNFQLDYAAQGKEGFSLICRALERRQPYSIAFIDIRMPPGWDGLQTAARIREMDPNIEIVIVTAYSDRSREEIATAVGACDKLLFLRKPFDAEELMQLAVALTQKWQTNKQLQLATLALQASETRFRSLVEATSDWVWEMDNAGCYTYCSPLCEKLYGYKQQELLGRCFYEILVPPHDRDEMRTTFENCLNNGVSCPARERPCLRQDGTIVYVESSSVPIRTDNGQVVGYRGIDRNISARKKQEAEMCFLQEQHRQSQKLGALGTLAGGIAHDMNNILTPILGFSELLMIQTEKNDPIFQPLKNIHDCSTKAADLIRQILAFTRKQPLDIKTISLNEVIGNFYKMLRRLIREDIELILTLHPDPWLVSADRSQMEQVLINVIVNARDAMETRGKTITITTKQRHIEADTSYDVSHQPLPAGEYVILQIADEGVGMNSQTKEKAFDPFFTTKEAGKGTGLGLSTVYGIIGQHNGYIQLGSPPEQGAIFRFFLPRSHTKSIPAQDKAKQPELPPQGTETILLVEDNHDVRAMVSSTIKRLGYQVITSHNGQQGLALYKQKQADIALVISDIIMPIMGGLEMVQRIRSLTPQQPILFISGYAFENTIENMVQTPHCLHLQKPFTLQDIAESIRDLLDEASQTN